jgi:hypothetical protein
MLETLNITGGCAKAFTAPGNDFQTPFLHLLIYNRDRLKKSGLA